MKYMEKNLPTLDQSFSTSCIVFRIFTTFLLGMSLHIMELHNSAASALFNLGHVFFFTSQLMTRHEQDPINWQLPLDLRPRLSVPYHGNIMYRSACPNYLFPLKGESCHATSTISYSIDLQPTQQRINLYHAF